MLFTAKNRLQLVAPIDSKRLISLPTSRITSIRPKSMTFLAANCARPLAFSIAISQSGRVRLQNIYRVHLAQYEVLMKRAQALALLLGGGALGGLALRQ